MRRNYMGTINFDQDGGNPLQFLPDWSKIRRIKNVTFQLELASRLHWQVFLEFTDGVSITNIQDDIKSQGKHIAIKPPEDKWKHPKAGRNYVTKGTAVDGHRYFWSNAQGYVGKAPDIKFQSCDDYSNIETTLRTVYFDGKNAEQVKERLKDMAKQCREYILKSVNPIKII